MMVLNQRLSIFFSILCFFGCGAGSIYNSSYYSETILEDNLIRVTFRGGQAPMTGDLCLLRCAEVTLNADRKYFQVVDSESGSSNRSFSSHYPFHRHQIYSDPFVDDLASVTKTIQLSDDKPINGFAYEALKVKSSLTRKYKINLSR